MDYDELQRILMEVQPLRTGPAVKNEKIGDVPVTTIDTMAPSERVTSPQLIKVSVHFFDCAIERKVRDNPNTRRATRQRLIHWLEANYGHGEWAEGDPIGLLHRLHDSVSYIEFAASAGVEQEAAMRLMALGAACGLWDLVTPASLGVKGEDADKLARLGMVYTAGWHPHGDAPTMDAVGNQQDYADETPA